MKMYDEETLTEVVNHFKSTMPAEKYIMLIYGHGGGWDQLNDYVREWLNKLETKPTGKTPKSFFRNPYQESSTVWVGVSYLLKAIGS